VPGHAGIIICKAATCSAAHPFAAIAFAQLLLTLNDLAINDPNHGNYSDDYRLKWPVPPSGINDCCGEACQACMWSTLIRCRS
jgi:hypothetical protein